MDLSAFKPAPPVSVGPPLPQSPSAAAPQEEQYVTETTPNGMEIFYSWEPRRHYKLRHHPDCIDKPWFNNYQGAFDWQEVPSVSNIVKLVDDAGGLIWWGMKIGIAGTLQSVDKSQLVDEKLDANAPEVENVVAMLGQRKLTVNDRQNEASTRGTNVHKAMEFWCDTGAIPQWDDFPETEAGYVKALAALLSDLGDAVTDVEAEMMVGSLEHRFAGRCDLTFTLTRPVELTTRVYPKRKPKVEEIPAGRHRWDLKTSKYVMPKHHLQNEGYEGAAIECGYSATDFRAIAHCMADGRYELVLNQDWDFDDFLVVRKCWQTMNERSVVQALRDELDAKDAA